VWSRLWSHFLTGSSNFDWRIFGTLVSAGGSGRKNVFRAAKFSLEKLFQLKTPTLIFNRYCSFGNPIESLLSQVVQWVVQPHFVVRTGVRIELVFENWVWLPATV
jgi:hypothetical protein